MKNTYSDKMFFKFQTKMYNIFDTLTLIKHNLKLSKYIYTGNRVILFMKCFFYM